LRGVSKDGPGVRVAHPSRLAVKNGEHLRMTAMFFSPPAFAGTTFEALPIRQFLFQSPAINSAKQ
jgi:hypothetical protein